MIYKEIGSVQQLIQPISIKNGKQGTRWIGTAKSTQTMTGVWDKRGVLTEFAL